MVWLNILEVIWIEILGSFALETLKLILELLISFNFLADSYMYFVAHYISTRTPQPIDPFVRKFCSILQKCREWRVGLRSNICNSISIILFPIIDLCIFLSIKFGVKSFYQFLEYIWNLTEIFAKHCWHVQWLGFMFSNPFLTDFNQFWPLLQGVDSLKRLIT